MENHFSMCRHLRWEENESQTGYWKMVYDHFSALHGMSLDYYGADTGSHEFKLDGIIFKVLEDPGDGYRSHLGVIE